jgi:Type I phosphodiesterase / nucleotide pyrophosphatase
MRGTSKLGALAAVLAAAGAIIVPTVSVAHSHGNRQARSHGTGQRGHGHSVSHVLLISVDGLHQSDLRWYAANHPGSELAKLASGGAEYSNAHTAVPSDSDPGGTALMTGGDPRATGVYYDVEYNRSLYEAGTTSCHGQATGADVGFDSPDDINVNSLDAGQGIPGLASDPSKIMQMTGTPQTLPSCSPQRRRSGVRCCRGATCPARGPRVRC